MVLCASGHTVDRLRNAGVQAEGRRTGRGATASGTGKQVFASGCLPVSWRTSRLKQMCVWVQGPAYRPRAGVQAEGHGIWAEGPLAGVRQVLYRCTPVSVCQSTGEQVASDAVRRLANTGAHGPLGQGSAGG